MRVYNRKPGPIHDLYFEKIKPPHRSWTLWVGVTFLALAPFDWTASLAMGSPKMVLASIAAIIISMRVMAHSRIKLF